jgi:hypothetical protein
MIVAIGFAVFFVTHNSAPAGQSAQTTGTVTSLGQDGRCTVSFVVQGVTYHVYQYGIGNCPVALGDTSPINYSPSDPTDASVAMPQHFKSIMLFVVGVVVLGAINTVVMSFRRERRR